MEKINVKMMQADSVQNLAIKEKRPEKKRKYVWDYVVLLNEIKYLKTKK